MPNVAFPSFQKSYLTRCIEWYMECSLFWKSTLTLEYFMINAMIGALCHAMVGLFLLGLLFYIFFVGIAENHAASIRENNRQLSDYLKVIQALQEDSKALLLALRQHNEKQKNHIETLQGNNEVLAKQLKQFRVNNELLGKHAAHFFDRETQLVEDLTQTKVELKAQFDVIQKQLEDIQALSQALQKVDLKPLTVLETQLDRLVRNLSIFNDSNLTSQENTSTL